jgi:HSP20 family protein
VAHVCEEDKKTNASQSTDKSQPADKSQTAEKIVKNFCNLGGLFGGLGGLIEKLGELAENGQKLSQSGEFKDAAGKFHGVYGINVRTAMGEGGETEVKVEPFGNVRKASDERPQGEDVREPLVDIHEETDHILVLIELPGVAKESVKLKLADGCLELSAERGKTAYRKDIELPKGCVEKKMSWECSNGILQVRFER